MAHDRPNVWLITGTSSGLGHSLVESVLARGDLVIATARSLEKIQNFPSTDRLRRLQLNVDDSPEVIRARIDEAVGYWGRIDVLVNNAGIGIKGVFEEGGSDAAMKQYRTNVFGLINVTTATLPHMRAARSGTVVMIGSRSCWQPTVPQSGFYTSSKAAVHTFSETLSVEVAQFNIRILIVEPGGFLTAGMFALPFYRENPISDYEPMRTASTGAYRSLSGSFKGDPKKAMELIVDVVRGEGKAQGRPWPLYLFLGNEAYDSVRDKCRQILDTLDAWQDVGKNLNFDDNAESHAV
ncbi:hypothetical protein AX17_005453 [Amanita inopinata Kibby_2008]|nr:hypothetical protein AX17_005453 [Amanita inopinata Kibby_2008]